MVSENLALKAALSYAQRGFQVLPIKGKRPLAGGGIGLYDASSSPDMIRAWWSEHPEYGVAIRIPEWAVLLDLDPNGKKSLAAFGLTLPDTPRTITGRGSHHWFEIPPEYMKSNKTRKIAYFQDVDVLVNGYVIAPPTLHYSGKPYAWDEEAPKLTRDNCERAPDWVLLAIEEEEKRSQGMSDDDFYDGLKKGQRQTGLFRRACRLRQIGNSMGEAKAILRELAERSDFKEENTDKLVERVWKRYEDGKARAQESADREIKVWSLADLIATEQGGQNYLIDSLLPAAGYTILFGAQGSGKSVLAGQAALAVATGTRFLGRYDTERRGVLALDVEQDPNGASHRWRSMLCGSGVGQVPANLYTAFEWPVVGSGGLERLEKFLIDHPHVGLVVLDTLYSFWPDDQWENNSSDPQLRDRKVMEKFNRFSKEYDVSFLVVHHSRKSQAGRDDDFSDMASGSRGITSPARARWGLARKSFDEVGTLMVGGKVPASKMTITFDELHLMWR